MEKGRGPVARRAAGREEAKREVESEGGKAAALPADLADRVALRDAAKRCSAFFGDPDILVNAAGINRRGPLPDITEEDWDATLAINLAVPFFLSQALAPAMQRRGRGPNLHICLLYTSDAADARPSVDLGGRRINKKKKKKKHT